MIEGEHCVFRARCQGHFLGAWQPQTVAAICSKELLLGDPLVENHMQRSACIDADRMGACLQMKSGCSIDGKKSLLFPTESQQA